MRAALVLTALAFLTPVQAASARSYAAYYFYGLVTQSTGGPPPGTVVPIRIVVDTHFPAENPPKNHVETYSGGSGDNLPSPLRSVTADRQNAQGTFDSITISRGNQGRYGISISSTAAMGVFFAVQFSTASAGVVHNYKIPRRIYPGSYPSATFQVGTGPGLGYSGNIVE